MDVRDAIRGNLESANFILNSYRADLTDQDLLKRVVPQANHIAWQLGHLIASTNMSIEVLSAGKAPQLPENFVSAHSKETTTVDTASTFQTKATYVDLFAKQKEVLKQIIEQIPLSDLDKPGPESMRSYAPTLGSVLTMAGTHILMHVGQIAVLRRALGKPIVI